MTHFTVLGGKGQIGSRLASLLVAQNYEVWVPERDDPRLFSQDLGHVIYAIGVTADFRTRPIQTMIAHVSVLAEVLDRTKFDSLLYLSSVRLYKGCAIGDEKGHLTVCPSKCSDLYNISKLAGESLCFHCDRPNVRIVRLSNVVGAEQDDSPNFLPSLVREARQGKVQLRTALASSKDYIHIDDVVGLLPRIALHGRTSYIIWQVVDRLPMHSG